MSTTHAAPRAHEETVHGAGHAHPTDRNYVNIAVILGVLTAAEVATYYVEEQLGSLLAPILIVMMIVKFAIVAMWFMHLRFDSRLFTRMFTAGLVLATIVYLIFLTTMQFFGDDTTSVVDERGSAPVQVVDGS